MSDLARDIVRQWERLEQDRYIFKTHWQEVADFMLPDRNDYIVERWPGVKRMQRVFDATPIWALEQFAAGLHTYLTNSELRWFSLKAQDDRLNKIDRVRDWLDDASEHLYSIFNGPQHNFAAQSHELYLDQGSIGTACMAVMESARSGILFSTRHMKEVCIAENEEDRVDTVIRNWKWTAKQAVDMWHDAAGPIINDAAQKTPERRFQFLHCVRPRKDRRRLRDKLFESTYIALDHYREISHGGFDEFPYIVPRFSKLTGEIYGRGPGMTVLPDVKMLNELKKLVVKSAQLRIGPPLMIPDDGFFLPIKTVPNSLNFYRAGAQGEIKPIFEGQDVQLGVEMLAQLQQQIIRGMYVEWMLMPSADPQDPASEGKGITATYVLQRRDEKMRLMSPMLARGQSEYLGPMLDRTFNIEWRKSLRLRFGPTAPFAPPPPELSGAQLRVEYVSPVALAQKGSQTDAIARLLQMAQMMLPLDPKAGQALNSEALLHLVARDYNTPGQILKSPQQLAQERQAQAEAEQAMAGHAQLEQAGKGVRDLTHGVKNLADAANTGNQLAEAA